MTGLQTRRGTERWPPEEDSLAGTRHESNSAKSPPGRMPSLNITCTSNANISSQIHPFKKFKKFKKKFKNSKFKKN